MTETSEGLAQGRHRGKVRRRPMRKVLGWLGEALLTLLSIFGVVCVGAVIAAYIFGVNIMMFKTGSMSPGIPAGSVALVREIPAAEAEIGDVITVERPGQLPITHRVISNESDPENLPNGQIIEMKGDDNPNPDPFPYQVEEVKLLFWSQPELGHVVAGLADPRVLGIVTMLAALIVTWAFWPRSVGQDEKSEKL
ncbi:signal peptidase I [Corynebacterium sp. A21]|uniref:signal peptidase I n=1 Tax=Corynebacterium sp. A21 TaxID=3457318 RepID=UPI003FD223B7